MIFRENDSVEVNNQRNKGNLHTSYILYITHVLSCFSRVRLFATLWTIAHQVPLSMELPRPEYWSGLPCTPPGDLPDPGIKPVSQMSPSLADRFFTTITPGKPIHNIGCFKFKNINSNCSELLWAHNMMKISVYFVQIISCKITILEDKKNRVSLTFTSLQDRIMCVM